jgi:hypothetical protein
VTEPTARQLEILVAYVEAGSMRAAGARLGVAEFVVRDTLAAIRTCLRARNTAQAFALAVRDGLIDPHELDPDLAA